MKLIITLVLSCIALTASAQDVCLNVDDSTNLILKASSTKSSEVVVLQKLLDEFIATAKQSGDKKFDKKRLLNKFSKFDASKSHLQKEWMKMPDKFSLYTGIDSAIIGQSFDWGSYKVAVVQYEYQGQKAQEAQAFFCTKSGCRLSNILERANMAEEIALRFFHQLKFNQWKSDVCPSYAPTYSVIPTVNRVSKQFPIDVFVKFNPDKVLTKKAKLDPDGKLKNDVGSFFRCIDTARKQDIDALYSDASNLLVKAFLSDCTVNMDLGNMVPVLRGSKIVYLPPISLMNTLKDSTLKPLAMLRDNEVDYQVLGLMNEEHVSSLLVLPLVGSSTRRIDWNYFDRNISNLLLTPELKRTISMKTK